MLNLLVLIMDPQWIKFANSQQEYQEKLREKDRREMKLHPHQDLMSFMGMRKHCDKTIKMTDEDFKQIPNKYLLDVKGSLPSNFVDPAMKGPPSEQQLKTDISLLASLLGGYNPPRICNIPPLDDQALETLSFPPTFQPKQMNRRPMPPTQPMHGRPI